MSSEQMRRRRFEALAQEVYEPVQRYVRRRVSAPAVDDVVSETMLTLWRRLDDIPPADGLFWAYGVARRQIANHRRGAARHLRLLGRMAAEPVREQPGEHPLAPELESAMGKLGEQDQEILRLWAWEGLEPREIALMMGLTPNAVSIRLHRATVKLAGYFEIERKNETASGHSHRARRKEERPWPTTS
jgi:RNA polymerase sigma-70 factor (ECF subfamily)